MAPRTLETRYEPGQMFCNTKLLAQATAAGQLLAQQIIGPNPPDDVPAAVRQFLEQHAQAVGSHRIAEFRRQLTEKVEVLDHLAISARLNDLLTAAETFGRRMVLADVVAGRLFAWPL